MLRDIDDIHPFIRPIVDLTVHIIELLDKIRCQEFLRRPRADHLPPCIAISLSQYIAAIFRSCTAATTV